MGFDIDGEFLYQQLECGALSPLDLEVGKEVCRDDSW